jgi:hypothetical protein
MELSILRAQGDTMSSESVAAETESNSDVYRRMFWLGVVLNLIATLYYEYMWSWFVLHNRGVASFGKWSSTALGIAAPCIFCNFCLTKLKNAFKEGKISLNLRMKLSTDISFTLLAVYVWFAPNIQRLTSLGVFK